MSANQSICPKCGAVIKGDACLACGFLPESEQVTTSILPQNAAAESKNTPEKETESNEEVMQLDEPTEEVKPAEPEVTKSIFTELAAQSKDQSARMQIEVDTPQNPAKRFIAPGILALLLLALAAASYWRFIYFTPDYISPLVLAATAQSSEVESLSDTEKTLDMQVELQEGNFDRFEFEEFASPDIALMIHAFDIERVSNSYISDGVIDEVQEVFDLSDDDLDVYFSKDFAIFFPEQDLKIWGFAINVTDKEFVDEKLAVLTKEQENDDFKYSGYYAGVVTKGENAFKEVLEEEDSEDEENTDSEEESDENTESEDTENEAAEPTEELEEPEAKYYLLVSNSKEYFDQMRESSEGNVPNLAGDVKFAQSKLSLPTIGQVYIYRDDSVQAWDIFSGYIASKISYEGIDKILKSIQAKGLAIYSKDSKLKIVSSSSNQ